MVSRRSVEVVHRISDRAILSGPLQAGDKIVTRGNMNLTDGTLVEVVE